VTDDEYLAWSDRHAATFGLTAEADARMFLAWRAVFEAGRVTAAELAAATLRIGTSPDRMPRYRNEYLRAVQDAVREIRQQSRQAQLRRHPESAGERGECVLCGDTGHVAGLPLLQQVQAGEWVPDGATYYTCAALCSCAAGRRRHEALQASGADDAIKARAGYTLELYEMANPRWRDQLHGREAARAAAQRAEAATRAADAAGPMRLRAAVQAVVERATAGRADAEPAADRGDAWEPESADSQPQPQDED
jgi:hypothetical protein